MDKHLHIISHDIPWPVKHGGLVDLYYKIKYLAADGVKIHLHCFYKNSFVKHFELEHLCEEVHYYQRNKFPSRGIPYIVSSRNSGLLSERLLKDNYPVLLEGIHCTAILSDSRFINRKIVVRLHNVEHIYYRKLFELEKGFKRIYFHREAKLLSEYEKSIASKALFLGVSETDCSYYRDQFGAVCEFLPVFVPWEKVSSIPGSGDYALYHGNLSVNENSEMAIRLTETSSSVNLKIAGYKPSKKLQEKAAMMNVELITNPSDEELGSLIRNAHVNILPSLNSTGVKLKLLNALFNGRHCLANDQAIEGSGLEQSCTLSEEPGWAEKLNELMKIPFTPEMITLREGLLHKIYNNEANSQKLISYLY